MKNIFKVTAPYEQLVNDNESERPNVPSTSAALEKSTKDETVCDAPGREESFCSTTTKTKTNANVKTTSVNVYNIDNKLSLDSGFTINHSEQSDDEVHVSKLINTEPSVPGGGMKNILHNISYQIKLSMLYIVRGLQQNWQFQVIKNIEGAGKLDDLLFMYIDDAILFLQAQHKFNKGLKITEDQLLSAESDFSITNYFHCYNHILHEIELQKGLKDMIFILNSNICFDDSILESFELLNEAVISSRLLDNKILDIGGAKYYIVKNKSSLYEKAADLLKESEQPSTRLVESLAKAVVNNEKKIIRVEEAFEKYGEWLLANVLEVCKEDNNTHFVTFRDDFLSGSNKSVLHFRKVFLETYLSNKQIGKNDTACFQEDLSGAIFQVSKSFVLSTKNEKEKIRQDEVRRFFDSVVFVVNQPNETQLGDIIKKEIGDYVGLTNRHSVACKFKLYIQDWVKLKEGRCLTNEDIQRQFAIWGQETLNQIRINDVKKYGCTFEESNEVIVKMLNFLNTDNDTNVLCLFDQVTLFSKMKVCQVLEYFASQNIDEKFIFCDINDLIELEHTKNCLVKAFSSQTYNILYVSLQNNKLHDIEVLNRLLQIVIQSNRSAEKPFYGKSNEIAKNKLRKRLIISIPEEEKSMFVKKICFNNLKSFALTDFGNIFSALNKKSRRHLMEKGRIKLHGNYVTGLLTENELALYIRDEMLFKFISNELEINEILVVTNHYYNKEVKQHYVNRSLLPVIIRRSIISSSEFHVARENIPPEKVKNQEVIVISSNKKFFEYYRKTNINVHWLKETNHEYIWVTSQGTLTNLRGYVIEHDPDLDQDSYFYPDSDSDTDLYLDSDIDSYSDLDSDSDSCPDIDPNSDSYPDINSRRDLDSNQHPGREHKNCIPITNINDLINDKVLISACPGMGKSILLSHIAEQSKKEDTSFFVITTNLADYVEQLDNLKTEKNITFKQALHFIFITTQIESPQIEESDSAFNLLTVQEDRSVVFSPNARFDHLNHLRATIFCKLYNQEKIVLLLDGFDEIAPDYCKTTLKLLQTLKRSKVRKMWVTTRAYGITKDLENVLETFAYTLKPLSKNDQLALIRSFWQDKIIPRNENNDIISSEEDFLNSVNVSNLTALHAETNQNPNERTLSFMSVPLHCYMLAKIWTNDFVKYCLQYNDMTAVSNTLLTTFDLYSKFCNAKFDEVLHNEYLKNSKNTFLREEKKLVESDYGKLALLEIFDKKLLTELIPDDDRIRLLNFIKNEKLKTGIVTEVVDNQPRFVHRTFAEYFAAHYLAKILLNPINHKRKEAAKLLLYNSVTSSSEYYYVLFTFFNYIVISKSNNKDIFEAAICGDIRKLSETENLNTMFDPLNRTPMHLVTSNLFKFLNNFPNAYRGVETSFTTDTNFHIFIQRLCQSMIERFADTLFSWTPTHYLALCPFKYISAKNSILIQYFNDNTQDTLGRTPLMLLILNSSLSVRWTKYSVSYNLTCVNNQDQFLKTALHYALKNFKNKIVNNSSYRKEPRKRRTTLETIEHLERKYNPYPGNKCICSDEIDRISSRASEKRNHMFEISLWQKHIEVICFLLKHGARIDIQDDEDITSVDVINSVVTEETKHLFEQLSDHQKRIIDKYDCDDLNLIRVNYIAEHVEKHGCNASIFEVDEVNTLDHMEFAAFYNAVKQSVSNCVKKFTNKIRPCSQTLSARSKFRVNSNIKNLLVCTLSKQLLQDYDQPVLPEFTSNLFTLWFIDEIPPEVAENFIKNTDMVKLSPNNDNHRNIFVFILTKTKTIAQILMSTFPHLVDAVDARGRTAVHYAVKNKNKHCVTSLIKSNARVDIKDNLGKKPVQVNKLSILNSSDTYDRDIFDFIETLSLEIANPLVLTMNLDLIQTQIDADFICYVLRFKRTIAHVVLSHYPDVVNIKDHKGRTALHYAVEDEDVAVVCFLIGKNALADIADNDGKYPVHLKKEYPFYLAKKNTKRSRKQLGNLKETYDDHNKKMLRFINTLPFEVAKPLILTMALVPPLTPSDHVLLTYISEHQLKTIASVFWAEYSHLVPLP